MSVKLIGTKYEYVISKPTYCRQEMHLKQIDPRGRYSCPDEIITYTLAVVTYTNWVTAPMFRQC